MATAQKPPALRWLVLLPLPLLWLLAGQLGWLDFFEHKTVDWRFKARAELPSPLKVVYVDIDAASIADIGNLPWDRAYYADVAQALLAEGRAQAIGIDLVFSENGRCDLLDDARFTHGTERLARFLSPADTAPPRVVLAASYAAAQGRDANHQAILRELPRVHSAAVGDHSSEPPELPSLPLGNLTMSPPYVGLIDSIDGGTRRVPLFASCGEKTWHHMAVELARLHWDLPPSAVRITADELHFLDSDGSVKRALRLSDHQDLDVNWFSAWQSSQNPRTSFARVLAATQLLRSEVVGEREAAKEFFTQFHDAVILIGPVDELLQDLATTSLDPRPVPKVGIHGNLLKTIVSGKQLHTLGQPAQYALTLLLTGAICALVGWPGSQRNTRRLAACALTGAYAAFAFFAFTRWHWLLPLVAPLGAVFTTGFAAILWQLAHEERQKSRIKNLFGTYLSPELVTRMVESQEEPRLGGEEVAITAYFSDIQDFTSFAETLPPARLVELMNEYLTACTDIITAQGGTLDKYIGDAVVAMFGAPVPLTDHAYRACVTALLVQQKQLELREKWLLETGRWPVAVTKMQTRIGLNSGPAVVGNMGSLTRFNYTMMGDSVNLASRLEAAARTYGVASLVTDATRHACEQAGEACVFRFLDRIHVKGRTQPVGIHELVCLRSQLTPALTESLRLFAEGMAHYHARRWAEARTSFAAADALQPDNASAAQTYVRRCTHMLSTPPPPSWDGVFTHTAK